MLPGAPAVEVVEEQVCQLFAPADGVGGHVRGDEDTGQIPQGGRGQQRVALEHVERGPGEGACPKGGHDERGLVDELAPRTLISWAVGEMAASSAAPVIPVRSTRGARRTIEDQLSEKILFGEVAPSQIVIVDVALPHLADPQRFARLVAATASWEGPRLAR